MEEENRTSKFSSGLNIISRLDELWRNCQRFKREGKYSDWNDELDTIWLELARDIDEKDKYEDKIDDKGNITKGYNSLFKEFDKKMKEVLPFNDSNKSFTLLTKEDYKRRDKQYNILMEKQLFLARLENETGKGTSWGEQEDDWD